MDNLGWIRRLNIKIQDFFFYFFHLIDYVFPFLCLGLKMKIIDGRNSETIKINVKGNKVDTVCILIMENIVFFKYFLWDLELTYIWCFSWLQMTLKSPDWLCLRISFYHSWLCLLKMTFKCLNQQLHCSTKF